MMNSVGFEYPRSGTGGGEIVNFRICACGCGTQFRAVGLRKFVDGAHRQKAYRRRVQARVTIREQKIPLATSRVVEKGGGVLGLSVRVPRGSRMGGGRSMAPHRVGEQGGP